MEAEMNRQKSENIFNIKPITSTFEVKMFEYKNQQMQNVLFELKTKCAPGIKISVVYLWLFLLWLISELLS